MKNIKFLIMLFVSILLYECAYFNTFYNANYRFKKIEKKIELNSKQLSNNINTLGLDEASKKEYEDIINQCTKLIYEYPESKYVPNSLLIMSISYYRMKKYSLALKKLEEFETYFPNHKLLPEVYYYHAKIYVEQGEHLKAYDIAKNALKFNKESKWTFEIYKILINKDINDKSYQFAESKINEIFENNTNLKKELKANILFLKFNNFYLQRKYDEALVIYNELKKYDLEEELLFDTNEIYCYILQKNGKGKEAYEIYKDMENSFKNIKLKIKSKLRAYQFLAEIESPEVAIKSLEKFLNDNMTISVEYRAEAYYLMAEIYLNYLTDYKKAVEILDKIKKDYYQTIYSIKAGYMLSKISYFNKDNNSQDLHKNEKEKIAESNYDIAINFLFELDNIQKANEKLDEIIKDYANTNVAPKAIFAKAWIYNNRMQDKNNYIQLLNQIIEKYPTSIYAAYSKQILNGDKNLDINSLEEYYDEEFNNYKKIFSQTDTLKE